MNFKSLLSVVLVLALVFSFTACTSANDGKKDNKDVSSGTAAETTAIEVDENPLMLAEGLNYGGAKIRILCEAENLEPTIEGELLVESLTNEAVNDAVYNRELYVEELLGVELETVIPEGMHTMPYVERMHNAGEAPAEIVTGFNDASVWFAQNGYFYDLNSIENLNLDSIWWSQDFNYEASVGDKLYFVTGDIAISLLRDIYVTFFNKKIADDNGIEGVYDTVFDGKWTLDKLVELSSKVYIDANGNSVSDTEDIFGFMGAALCTDPLWSAFDIDILSKDGDGYLVYNSPIEKFGSAHEKIYDLFNLKTSYGRGVYWNDCDMNKPFSEDHCLFTIAEMVAVESELFRNMQSEYGIIPLPKYDEAQAGYYTMPHDSFTVFGIARTLPKEDADMVGAVLEAMGWYSNHYLTPAYLDVAMKGKYANDSETRQMIDIVIDGMKIDAAWIYAYSLSGYPQTWRYLIHDNVREFASEMTAKERNIKIQLKELNRAFSSELED